MDAACAGRAQADGVLSIMLARPERRNAITVAMYAALADAIESAADDRVDPADHDRGPGRGFHRRQRPRRFPAGDARARLGRGYPGLAAAARAGQEPGADHRRGARQCGRHRHDHAVPLRFRAGRGRLPLRHAVRRPGPGAGGGQLAALPAPRRPPPRRAPSAAGRAVRRRRGARHGPCQPCRPARAS